MACLSHCEPFARCGGRGERELKQEDRAWFEPLAENLGPVALKFAYVQVRNLEEAQDIVQEAFARVWASNRTPRPEAEFKRWLYRAITNLVRDRYRREQRLTTIVAGGHLTTLPGDEFERWVSSESIMEALRRLSIRDRQLLYLRYFEDQPLSECARLLGLHPVSVRVLVRRAVGRLRQEMCASDPRPEVVSDAP